MIQDRDTLTWGLPNVDAQDIAQEMALLVLLGKVPSKALIRRRLQGQARELLVGTLRDSDSADLLEGKISGLLFCPPSPNLGAIEDLVLWALGRDSKVQDLVFSTLSGSLSPEKALEGLKSLGALAPAQPGAPATRSPCFSSAGSGTLTALILRSLPATKESLYSLAIREHTAKRPEAAVRQILRRLSRNGTLIVTHTPEGEVYSHA